MQPKRMKHPKWHKGRSKGVASRGNRLSFGSFGLKAMGTKWITDRQLEACRMTMVKEMKKKGKFWLRVFPHKPITSKGVEFGMGSGKGKVDHYVFPVRPGNMLFELEGIEEIKAKDILKKVAAKLPIKTKILMR